MRARDRPRIVCRIGKIVAEFVILVGHHQHVIADALREMRDFGARRRNGRYRSGARRADRSRACRRRALPELLDRVPHRRRIGAVRLGRAGDQEDVAPLLHQQIFHERVRQHGAARQRVQHIGAAFPGAQLVVGRSGIEERDTLRRRQVGDRQQRARRQVGRHQADAVAGELAEARRDTATLGHDHLLEREMLVGEAAGGVVVLDREARAGDAFIGRRRVEIGLRRQALQRLREEADAQRLGRFLVGGARRQRRQRGRRDQNDGDDRAQNAAGKQYLSSLTLQRRRAAGPRFRRGLSAILATKRCASQ